MDRPEPWFRDLRQKNLPHDQTLEKLKDLAERRSLNPRENHSTSALNRHATLHAIENVVLPALAKGERVNEYLDILSLFLRPEQESWKPALETPVRKTEYDSETPESKEFAMELTTILLRNLSVFTRLTHHPTHDINVAYEMVAILDRAKQIGTWEYFSVGIQHTISELVHTFQSRTDQDELSYKGLKQQLLRMALAYGSESDRAWANKEMIDLVTGVAPPLLLDRPVDEYLKQVLVGKQDAPTQLAAESIQNLKPLFERLGIPLGGFLLSWRDSHASVPYAEYARQNIKRMLEVEERQKGAVAWLARERGIRAFSRYAAPFLAQQYRERDIILSAKRSPVICVYAQHDYAQGEHSSFEYCSPGVQKVYEPFSYLDDPPPVILIEASNPYALLSRLKHIAAQVPKNASGKTTVVLNGHGNLNGIQLSGRISGEKSKTHIRSRDLSKFKRHPYRKHFPEFPNGVVSILASCSTGKGKGSAGSRFAPFGESYAPVEWVVGDVSIAVEDTPRGAEIQEVLMTKTDGTLARVRRFRN